MKRWLLICMCCCPLVVVAQEQTKLVPPDIEADDFFGKSVSVDGDTAVIGAYVGGDITGVSGPDDSGAAYVYARIAGSWGMQTKLTASDAAAYDWFGGAVSVDGDTVVIGASSNDAVDVDSGAAYVFVRDAGGTWSEQEKLIPSDAEVADWIGGAVSIDGDTVVVGATGDDDAGSNSGAAYVFVRDAGGSWSEQQKLAAIDAAAVDDRFGKSVSVDGDTALIGAYQDDDKGDNAGAAFVFVRDVGGTWTQQAKLTAADGAGGHRFGEFVSISGDTALIGGWSTEAAYAFVRNAGGTWTQQAKLTSADGELGDDFGRAVSIDGVKAIIGAPHDGLSSLGAAYVFVRDAAGTWTEQAKLTANDAGPSDSLGGAVSLDGDTAVVGATGVDDAGRNSGAAYIFSKLVPIIFSDGFETGDTTAWSSAVP